MTDFADGSNDDLDDAIAKHDEKQDAETELLGKIAAGDPAAITEYAERFRKNHLRALQPDSIAFFVALQEKNQAAWLMLRQRLQQVGVKISAVDKLVKGRIEEKLAEDAKERAAKAAAGPSPAELKRLEKEKSDLRAAHWSKCRDIAESHTLMDDFVSIAQRYGVVEEERAIKATYLSAASRLSANSAVSVIREGAASSGKSFLTKTVLHFIPKEHVIKLSTASPKALAYMDGDNEAALKHMIISVGEVVSIAEREGEANELALMFRTILSEGELDHQVVVTRKNNTPLTINIHKDGPIVAMLTTARDNVDVELRTRVLSTKADETRDQTIKIVKRSFSTNTDPVRSDETEKWIAYQRWLAVDGPYEVYIPYLDAIGDSFEVEANNPKAPKEYPLRARRDATALKAAIGASAILHKAQRERDEIGRIVATLDDYRLAHDVIDPSTAEAHHIVIPETALAVVQAIEKIAEGRIQAVKVTVRALQEKLGISSTSMAAQRLFEAVDLGLIEIVERPDGKPYVERGPRYYKIVSSSDETKIRIEMGRALRVFPTSDEIARACGKGVAPPEKQRTAEQRAGKGQKVSPDQSDSSVLEKSEEKEQTPLKSSKAPKQAEQEPPLFCDDLGDDLAEGAMTEPDRLFAAPPALDQHSENRPNPAKPAKRIIEI